MEILPEAPVLPVARVVPVPARLAGHGAGAGAQPGQGPRHLARHVADGAAVAAARRGHGARAVRVQLLLGLHHARRRGAEHVGHRAPLPRAAAAPATCPRVARRPRPRGELTAPVLLVLLALDHVDAAPDEAHVAAAVAQLLLQQLHLLRQLGLQAQLEVVEGVALGHVVSLGEGPWPARQQRGRGRAGPAAGQHGHGLVVEPRHPRHGDRPRVDTDGQTHGQQPPRRGVVLLLVLPQRLLEDPDVVRVEEDVDLVPVAVVALDDAQVVRDVSDDDAAGADDGEGQEDLPLEVDHEAVPAGGEGGGVGVAEGVDGPHEVGGALPGPHHQRLVTHLLAAQPPVLGPRQRLVVEADGVPGREAVPGGRGRALAAVDPDVGDVEQNETVGLREDDPEALPLDEFLDEAFLLLDVDVLLPLPLHHTDGILVVRVEDVDGGLMAGLHHGRPPEQHHAHIRAVVRLLVAGQLDLLDIIVGNYLTVQVFVRLEAPRRVEEVSIQIVDGSHRVQLDQLLLLVSVLLTGGDSVRVRQHRRRIFNPTIIRIEVNIIGEITTGLHCAIVIDVFICGIQTWQIFPVHLFSLVHRRRHCL